MIRKINIKIIFIFFLFNILIYLHYYLLKPNTEGHINKDHDLVLATVTIAPPLAFDGHKDVKNSLETTNNEYVLGADVSFCKAIADKMHKKLKIKTFGTFEGAVNALSQGNADFCIGSFSATEKKAENFEIIKYYNTCASILVKSGNEKFSNILEENPIDLAGESFNHKELKLNTHTTSCFKENIERYYKDQEGQNKNNFSQENIPRTSSLLRNSTSECFRLVKDNQVDGFISDDLIIENLYRNHGSDFKKFELQLQEPTPPYGILLKKGNRNLKGGIETAINDIVYKSNSPSTDPDKLLKDITKVYSEKFVTPAFEDFKERNKKIEETDKTQHIIIKNIKKIWKTLPSYIKSFVNSLVVAIDSVILGFLLSLLLVKAKILVDYYRQIQKKALMKMYQAFSFVIDRFVSFLNAIPISIQSLLVFNLINMVDSFKNIKVAFYASLIVLLLNTIANLIQIMMHNINLLDKGQIEAGYALGMTQKQVFNYIIFEQGIKRTYPSVGKQFITNIKDTSLFQIIGFSSLLWQAQRNASLDFDIWTPYIIVCCVYLIIVFITNFILKKFKQDQHLRR